jgi:hypothetical protein
MSADSEKKARQGAELARECHAVFARQNPDAVGAALCELVALHLAGHFVAGDAVDTALMREMLLEAHIETVRKLVPIMEAIHTRPLFEEKRQ